MISKSLFGRSFNEFHGYDINNKIELFGKDNLFTDDLRMSSNTSNPTIIPNIDLVYVLSGRTTALKKDADKLKRAFDPEDDFARLQEGVRIASEICALRANKKAGELTSKDYVIPIFYNGRAIHNQDLQIALEQGIITYPKNLFIIQAITPENTHGQVLSFIKYLWTYKKYLVEEKHQNVAIVSSAYHLPRVARLFGLNSPQASYEKIVEIIGDVKEDDKHMYNPLSKLKLFLFGIHKDGNRCGICDDVRGEEGAMRFYTNYDKKPDNIPIISRNSSRNVFFTNEDIEIYKSFNAVMYWGSGSRERKENASKSTETAVQCSLLDGNLNRTTFR